MKDKFKLARAFAKLKVGDRVMIHHYSKDDNGKLAFITRINGTEVYVRRRWKNYEIQLYCTEVKRK